MADGLGDGPKRSTQPVPERSHGEKVAPFSQGLLKILLDTAQV